MPRMVLVALTVVAAIVVGWVRGGRLRHLGTAPIRGGVLAVAAAVAQAVHAAVSDPTVALGMTAASQAALLTFLWLNRYAAGVFLVAVGSTMNAAVILANGAMPVSRGAIMGVGRHPLEVAGRHRLLDPGDPLPLLADIIPLPLLRTVVSAGDVVLAAGVGLLVVSLMRRPRRAGASAAQPADRLGEPLA